MERLQITTLTAQDISSPLLAATFTAAADREILVQTYLSGLVGNGTYRSCITKQLGGAGTVYQSPTSGLAVSSGVTTAALLGIPIPVKNGDVVKVYVQGLTGDTSVGVQVEVFDVTALATASGGDVPTAAENATAVWANGTRSLTDKANFTLTTAYNAAKNAAAPGDKMDLVDALNAIAVLVIQEGLARAGADDDTLKDLSDQLDAIGTTVGAINVNDFLTGLWAKIVDGNITFGEFQAAMLGMLIGETTGGGTGTLVFLGQDGSTHRVTFTLDANKNRTAVATDFSDL
jgi:hypothetical protein